MLSSLIPPTQLRQLICDWLREDAPGFDVGGAVVGETMSSAVVLCKSPGILAGAPFFDAVFAELGCDVHWFAAEGDELRPVCEVGRVSGKVRSILLGERVALNCLCRASGVATAAARMREVAARSGWNGTIAGTRKTTPGFRLVEKYSLLVARVDPHRYDLSSMVMLKDNHIAACGGNIEKAVEKARQMAGRYVKIEVECTDAEQAQQAARANCDIIMLDNMTAQMGIEVAKSIKSTHSHILIEISGGINEKTIEDFCSPYVDIISSSKLTQGYSAIDFSLNIQ